VIGTKDWLERYELGRYAEVFARRDIELDIIQEFTDVAFEEKLGVSLGDCKRLRKAIESLTEVSPGLLKVNSRVFRIRIPWFPKIIALDTAFVDFFTEKQCGFTGQYTPIWSVPPKSVIIP